MAPGVARTAAVAYNVPREFCFRARWKSSLAVSTAGTARAARKPATLLRESQADPVRFRGQRSQSGWERQTFAFLAPRPTEGRCKRTQRDIMEACMKGIHTGSFSFLRGEAAPEDTPREEKEGPSWPTPRPRPIPLSAPPPCAPPRRTHGPEDHGEHEPLGHPRARDHRASVRHLGAPVLRRVPAAARRGVAVLRRLHHARGGLRLRLWPGGGSRLRHHLGGGPRHPVRRLHGRRS